MTDLFLYLFIQNISAPCTMASCMILALSPYLQTTLFLLYSENWIFWNMAQTYPAQLLQWLISLFTCLFKTSVRHADRSFYCTTLFEGETELQKASFCFQNLSTPFICVMHSFQLTSFYSFVICIYPYNVFHAWIAYFNMGRFPWSFTQGTPDFLV